MKPAQAPGPILAPTTTRRTTSDALLAGNSRLLIQHRGQDYILQLTRQGKLILTK